MRAAKILNIGLVAAGTKGWIGGVTYVESIARACRSLPAGTAPRLFLVVTDESLASLDCYRDVFPLCSSVAYLGSRPPEPVLAQIREAVPPGLPVSTLRRHRPGADILFPDLMGLVDRTRTVSWIPDLQHLRLPEFSSPDDIAGRNALIARLLEKRRPVVLSSEAVKADFLHYFGASLRSEVHVLHFHTLPREEWFRPDPAPLVRRLELPEKFLICCNQFWKHKNHAVLFEALEILARRGTVVPLVCTGQTHDSRWPGFFDESMDAICGTRIFPHIRFFGIMPREEQIQLIRAAAAMVQPSRFEGWSTIVEDARALGKTLFLSDLPVHREQTPPHTLFFDPARADALADLIEREWPGLAPGPDPVREAAGRREVEAKTVECGEAFLRIARDSIRAERRLLLRPSYWFGPLNRIATRARWKLRALAGR